MTREEAKEFLKEIAWDLGFTGIEEYGCKDGEKMREAIEVLEQEQNTDVLNKIKAEINEYGSLCVEYKIIGHTDKDIENIVEDVLKQAKQQVLDVIDKHKESEG